MPPSQDAVATAYEKLGQLDAATAFASPTTWTVAARGAFRDAPSARCEALSLIPDM